MCHLGRVLSHLFGVWSLRSVSQSLFYPQPLALTQVALGSFSRCCVLVVLASDPAICSTQPPSHLTSQLALCFHFDRPVILKDHACQTVSLLRTLGYSLQPMVSRPPPSSWHVMASSFLYPHLASFLRYCISGSSTFWIFCL